MNAEKLVAPAGVASDMVQVWRTTDIPMGMVIATVAASETNIEIAATISM